MTSADQVFRLKNAQALPPVAELVDAIRLAQARPGCSFEMPWYEEPQALYYTLKLRLAPNDAMPTWNLVARATETNHPLWAVCSNDAALVRMAVMPYLASADVLERSLDHTETVLRIPKAHTQQSLRETVDQQRTTHKLHLSVSATPKANINQQSDLIANNEFSAASVSGAATLIGDLLLRADLITTSDLAEALPLSKRTGLPIGRILIDSGRLNENSLRAAVLAQSLIRDGLLHTELAVKAIAKGAAEHTALDQSLKDLGWRSDYYQTTNKLGQLLIDSGCVDKERLGEALEVAFASGLPLGRVLVLRKVLPEVVAYAALSAQVLLRENKVARPEALAAIRLASSMKLSIQAWLERGGMAPANETKLVRLGELLILAGSVSELDLLSAVERGLLEERPIGQVLIRAGLIDDLVLNEALSLQSKVNNREIGLFQAADTLSRLQRGETSQISGTFQQQSPLAGRTDDSISGLLTTLGVAQEDDPRVILQEVILQKQNLAFKIVSQHEEVKHRLARELHDTIIADLLMLRRYLSGDRKLTVDQTIEIIDDVVRQLRDICNDFAPRHLHDWGLQLTIQDLADRVKARTGIDCAFVCEANLAVLPEPVQLHFFRIVQESLNNIEKYAKASHVTISVKQSEAGLKLLIEDNGSGFSTEAKTGGDGLQSGGTGMQSMQERLELIRCYLPATLSIESIKEKGSTVCLEISRS